MHGRGQTLECTEGEPFQVPADWRHRVLAAAHRLKKNLRPRAGSLTEIDGEFICRGIIGTIDLGQSTHLNVSPKVAAGADWITAVVRLLLGSDRVDAGGDRLASYSPQRRTLLDVFATQYANRLESALRRDGPILLLRRKEATLGFVKGKLRVSDWLQGGPANAHCLPVAYNELITNHPISAAMAGVARLLAAHSSLTSVRRRLLAAAQALRPGVGAQASFSPEVARENLPMQWRAYEPAWSLARAVIHQRSLLGPKGPHTGVCIAVEGWPLLERLLSRCLADMVDLAQAEGRSLASVVTGRSKPILVAQAGSGAQDHAVIPDGRLDEDGAPLVIFDAKYKRRNENDCETSI